MIFDNKKSKTAKPANEPRDQKPLFPSAAKSPLPIRRAAEFWVDVFCASISDLISNEDARNSDVSVHVQADTLVATARAIADAALKTYEERWPGVLLP